MKEFQDVYITGMGLASAAGDLAATHAALHSGQHSLQQAEGVPVGFLHEDIRRRLDRMAEDRPWSWHDRAVLLGVHAAGEAMAAADQSAASGGPRRGVVVGTSRGATALLEDSIGGFQRTGRIDNGRTSPTSTGGVFSSALAGEFHCEGFASTLSAACSSGLNAVGMAWLMLRQGFLREALAGGTEVSATPFTIEILKAAGVYGRHRQEEPWPCRPFHPERNGMVLGEGAAMLFLSSAPPRGAGPLARIHGFGAATEQGRSLTGTSDHAGGLQQAMAAALSTAEIGIDRIGLIICHGTGTVKGDAAEQRGIRQFFGDQHPPLVCHKWLTGHALGASAVLSLCLGVRHLGAGMVPGHPYFAGTDHVMARPVEVDRSRLMMVLSQGFGGHCAALIAGLP